MQYLFMLSPTCSQVAAFNTSSHCNTSAYSNTAGSYSNTAGSYSNTAGSYSNTAGSYSNTTGSKQHNRLKATKPCYGSQLHYKHHGIMGTVCKTDQSFSSRKKLIFKLCNICTSAACVWWYLTHTTLSQR